MKVDKQTFNQLISLSSTPLTVAGQPIGEVYIANAFSLSMLKEPEATIHVRRISLEEARSIVQRAARITSAIGHAGTAQLLTQLLGVEVPAERIQLRLGKGSKLIVFQILTRLGEGQVLDYEQLLDMLKKEQAAFFLVELI